MHVLKGGREEDEFHGECCVCVTCVLVERGVCVTTRLSIFYLLISML